MVDGQRQGQRAAEGMPDDQRTRDSQLRHQPGHEPRLLPQRGRARGLRVSAAGAVDHEEAVRSAQPLVERVGEALQLGRQPVEHHDRWPRAFVEVVQAHAIDRREAADCRHGRFGFSRDAPRETHKAGGDKQEHGNHDQDDDEHDSHDFTFKAT